LSQCVEGVTVLAPLGYLGESESGKIGRNDSLAIRETRNQLTVLKRRCWEAVQKKHHGSVRSAGFPVEDGYTVGFDAMDEGAWMKMRGIFIFPAVGCTRTEESKLPCPGPVAIRVPIVLLIIDKPPRPRLRFDGVSRPCA
jgi:hypothetical protein